MFFSQHVLSADSAQCDPSAHHQPGRQLWGCLHTHAMPIMKHFSLRCLVAAQSTMVMILAPPPPLPPRWAARGTSAPPSLDARSAPASRHRVTSARLPPPLAARSAPTSLTRVTSAPPPPLAARSAPMTAGRFLFDCLERQPSLDLFTFLLASRHFPFLPQPVLQFAISISPYILATCLYFSSIHCSTLWISRSSRRRWPSSPALTTMLP